LERGQMTVKMKQLRKELALRLERESGERMVWGSG
jgi:hypothetical protein